MGPAGASRMNKLENHQYAPRINVQCYNAWETGSLTALFLCLLKQLVVLSLILIVIFFSILYKSFEFSSLFPNGLLIKLAES